MRVVTLTGVVDLQYQHGARTTKVSFGKGFFSCAAFRTLEAAEGQSYRRRTRIDVSCDKRKAFRASLGQFVDQLVEMLRFSGPGRRGDNHVVGFHREQPIRNPSTVPAGLPVR